MAGEIQRADGQREVLRIRVGVFTESGEVLLGKLQ